MRMILAGEADAVLGVACLDALENTLDKILLAGVPSHGRPPAGQRLPRHVGGRGLGRADDRDAAPAGPAVLADLSAPDAGGGGDVRAGGIGAIALAALRQPVRFPPPTTSTPCSPPRAIACGFLAAGGKRSRPFITLAVYDALSGSGGTQSDGAAAAAQLPDAVKRVALAIEVFHKASLVHDDVEDDDPFRYGLPAVHRKHGVAAAINAGDYLIGLGYRLAAGVRESLGAETAADVAGRVRPRPYAALRRPGRRTPLARLAEQGPCAVGRLEDRRAEDLAGVRGGDALRRPPGRPHRRLP